MLAVGGNQHLTASVRDSAVSEGLPKATVDRRCQRAGLAVDDSHRAIFEHHRVDLVGYPWEFGLQFGSDAAGNQHYRKAIAPGLLDSRHGMCGYVAARCERAVEVERDRLEKRHGPSNLLPTRG
ncbi:hypothetical protein NIIDMKKI_45070 [Mycobacterium kansasii]|uniref:Uncharacterized protein n=1 Tax=Mycobacterium kansasii TaxID=1768 RepID=A0A7G1IE38_MYCKA|nr:hypothetical protein NIIDMKKI_45070 [Mycobacterium kansasii]